MERARAGSCAQWNANGHGAIRPPSPAKHGSVVHQCVEAEGCKTAELNFHHGLHAGESRTDAGVNDDSLAQGHVDEFLGVSCVFQCHVHAKGSGHFHVLTDEDAVVTVHRGDVRHGLLNGSSIGPSTLFRIGPSQFTHLKRWLRVWCTVQSGVALQMVGVRIGVMERCDALGNGLGLGPRHGQKRSFCSLDCSGLFRLHGFHVFLLGSQFQQQ